MPVGCRNIKSKAFLKSKSKGISSSLCYETFWKWLRSLKYGYAERKQETKIFGLDIEIG